MGIHTTEAIVLRRYPFRETSVIVNCLTPDFGKLKGLVKGLRAQPNRYRSAMEPFTINRIVFYDTRTSPLHLITQCDLVAPLSELPRDLEVMRTAAAATHLIDAVVPLEEPHAAVYGLFKHTLECLSLGGHPLALQTHFIARLLRLAGFQPQLDQCVGCTARVHSTGYWSVRQGGLLCPQCLHEDPRAEPASRGMLEAIETLSQADQPPAIDPALLPTLRSRLDEFLRWRLDRPFKTVTT